MDYNFPEVDNKTSGGGLKDDILNPELASQTGTGIINKQQQQYDEIQGHIDHSPSKLIDISSDFGEKFTQQHHKSDGSGSTDDFEHVYHDEPVFGNETGLNAKSSNNSAARDSAIAAGGGGIDMMEDFLGSTTKTNFDKYNSAAADLISNLESDIDQKINKTVDFINAERNEDFKKDPFASSTTTAAAAAKTTKNLSQAPDISSFSDAFGTTNYESDYQKEHYNPSPIKKSLKREDDEKFISSEDLLGDFKDERTKTPEHKAYSSSKVEPLSATSNIDNRLEDLLSDKDLIPSSSINTVPVTTSNIEKENIPKISEKSGKTEETAEKPKSTVTSGEMKKPLTKPSEDKKKVIEQSTPKQKMIQAEEIFYKFGLDTWFKPECLHPQVESLIYWRDVPKSGIVLGAGLIILLAVSCFSVISVFAYLSLTALACTIAFRIYKTVMGAVQKTSEGHPFKEYLEMDLNLSHEKVQQIVNVSVAHVNGFVSELRRLFLVEDFVDSIKFGVILWVFTYIGAWFNGMTLVILAFVSLFTLPKLYENNKQSIDMYLDLVRSKILEITDKVKAAIPIGKKPETDKDK